MEFSISFMMDNAAFSEYPEGEVAVILSTVSNKFRAGETDGNVRDTNGNTIGTWAVTD